MRALLVTLSCLWLSLSPAAETPPAEAPLPESPGGEAAPAEAPPADSQVDAQPAPRFEFKTFEDDPLGVKELTLDNGLTVLLSENHERPEVFGAVVVRTGGKNDPADNTGMAHYLEHMLFKGTTQLGTTDWAAEQPLQAQIVELYEQHAAANDESKRAALQREIAQVVEQTYAYALPNELDRMLAEIGGSGVNAFTTEDETVYHNTFPASQIETWLEIYAHRFVDPVFRLFPTELEAVYEEKNISLDRFEVKLLEGVMGRAFPEHPYGTQTVIGEVEHLKSPSLVAMREYFETYYVANNMALVLSGDFDAEAIMPVIEAQFGSWKRGPEPAQRSGEVEPFAGRELLELRLTPVRVGAYAFRTVPPSHPDYAALQVARALLFNEQGSGFIDALMDEGKILIALPYIQELADHGLDTVFFAPKILGQTFKKAESRVLDAFHRIGRGEFEETKMLALRDGLRREQDRQWEDNEARALAMASAFIRHEDWQGYLGYRARLATVTREEVMRVGQTYFGEDYLALRSRLGFPDKPRLSKPSYPSVTPQVGVHSEFYSELMGRTSPPAQLRMVDFEADIQRRELAPGVRLLSNENPFNDTYSLQLRFGVGTGAIRELSVACDYLGRVGTADYGPSELRERLSLLGTTLEIYAELDETVIALEGDEAHLAEALALVEGLLHHPRADKSRLKAMRRERRGLDRVSRRDPNFLAGALREYALHGQDSSYLRGYGKRGLAKLSAAQLFGAWGEMQAYALELRYVGTRTPEQLAPLLSKQLKIDASAPLTPAVEPVIYPRQLPARDTVYFIPRRDALQTQLGFIVDGEPVAREQLAAMEAYSEYFSGGMGGLVFQEIREFRALAYSAWARFYRDADLTQRGYLMGAIGCQGDKTFESMDVMLELIRDMPRKPERMGSVRASLTRRQETRSPGFRELIGRVDRWQQLGFEADPRAALLEAYPGLEFGDIEAFHAAQIADRPVIMTVVGDPRRIELDALREYGELIVLREKDVLPR